MSNALGGRTTLITGGSKGIGEGIARRFAAEGARVLITGRDQAELDAVAASIDGSVEGIRCNASDLDEIEALTAAVGDRVGRLDVLVANAGGGSFEPLGGITEDGFDQIFDVNVKGTVFTVQSALPLMREGGSIILTGSTAGSTGTPSFSVYSASKAAVRNLARSWILDLKGSGIRVNVLSPGPTRTQGLMGLLPADQQQGLFELFGQDVPLGRIGDPLEVAEAAVFLASDASSFVNGAELFVDGGLAQV